MRDLPGGWIAAKLSELATPRGERVPPAAHPDKQFVGLEHVESQTTRILGSVSAAEVKSSASLFRAGDVLYGRLRPYLNKVAKPDFDGLASAEFIVFPDQAHLRSGFLKHRLNAGDFASFATHLNAGDRPRVDFEQIGAFDIALPPPAEQQRIVEKLEELLSDLDAGVTALERARSNLKRYRAAVLKAAVEGRLTEKWRAAHTDTEPAEILLERILSERRKKWEEAQIKKYAAKEQSPPKGWKDRYPEPATPKAEALPALPTAWCWATLDQLADIGTGATPLRSEAKYWEGGSIPWVTSAVVNSPYVSEASEFVTPAALAETNLFLYPANTLVLAMYGEGKTRGKASELLLEATTNQALAALVFFEAASACRSYVKTFLAKSYEDMRRLASGGVQPNLNLGLIKEMRIPLPPLDEQAQITMVIDRLLSVQERLVQESEKSALRGSRLRQAILKRAFEGKLVPQDTKDEPASELLARIRAGRAVRVGEGRSRRTRK